jgi:hypothetical protein
MLSAHKKAYIIHGEASTTFHDLQMFPAVLLGADDDWANRMISSMRFHFGQDAKRRVTWIEDQQRPGVKIGTNEQANPQRSEDYGLVARVFDPQTHRPTIVLAGVTQDATRAAGEFVTKPVYLNDFSRNAPSDWDVKNLELLIKTNIVDGDPGPPQVIASYSWKP